MGRDGDNQIEDTFLKKGNGELFPFIPSTTITKENWTELQAEKVEIHELTLPTDQMESIYRRVLIGIHAYGLHDNRLASFCGLLPAQLKNIIASEEIQKALKEGVTPCWTKAELVSRLCVEAESAPTPRDRILAITKLMEFRSVTAPEGGARSFTRVIGRFGKGNHNGK